MAVTILDIAKETGKDYSTVSRALNNCGRMSEETRNQILEAAERLGYRPNFAGIALQRGRTNTIGVLLPELGNPFYADLLHHLKTACAEKGYDIAVYDYEYDREQEQHLLQKMYTGFCDGVLAAVSSLEYTGNILERLWKAHVPVTLMGTPSSPDFPPCYDRVSVNHNSAFAELFRYLVKCKKKHIVMTELPISQEISKLSRSMVTQIHREEKCPFSLNFYNLNLDKGSPVLTGVSAFQKIMKQYPETDAIIARNSMEIYGMLASAREQGIRVPDDLIFICCDNTWLNLYSSIPIIAIDQHAEELARHAFDMLSRRINTKNWSLADSFIVDSTTVFPNLYNP